MKHILLTRTFIDLIVRVNETEKNAHKIISTITAIIHYKDDISNHTRLIL